MSNIKYCLGTLNKFEEITRAGGGADAIEKMLGFLEQYAQKHFSFEEQRMEQHGCPVADQNKEAHRRFFMVFEKLRQRFEEEGADELLLEQIHSTVETWLVNHILGIDVQLRPIWVLRSCKIFCNNSVFVSVGTGTSSLHPNTPMLIEFPSFSLKLLYNSNASSPDLLSELLRPLYQSFRPDKEALIPFH